MTVPSGPSTDGPRGPLSYRVFQAIWIAAICSYTGTWIQDVAESWSILSLTTQPSIVALVTTCNTVPGFLLMLPAGVLSDRFDRRRIILLAQTWLACVAGALAIATWMHLLTPSAIFVASAGLGIGNAMTIPAWQTLLPELVPREQMPEAVTLNSVAFNIARSVGPAIGGFILSFAGAGAAFALNALSFLAVIEVVRRYPEVRAASEKRRRRHSDDENFGGAMVRAVTYALRTRRIRALYIATALFTIGSGPIAALMPLFAKQVLRTDALGYGVLLGTLGAGAVTSAIILKRVRPLLPARTLLVSAMLLHGVAAVPMTFATTLPVAASLYFVSGMAWIATYTTLNSLVQLTSPRWVRSRTMALYHIAYLVTVALGSSAGGFFSTPQHLGVTLTLRTAALMTALAAAATKLLAIPSYDDDAEGLEELATPLPAE